MEGKPAFTAGFFIFTLPSFPASGGATDTNRSGGMGPLPWETDPAAERIPDRGRSPGMEAVPGPRAGAGGAEPFPRPPAGIRPVFVNTQPSGGVCTAS